MVNEGEGQSQVSWKERRKQQLHDEFVGVAARLFAANGIEATSVENIVSEAGVAKGTFYLYFKSKTEVVGLVMDTLLDKLQASIQEATAGSPEDARIKLKTLLRTHLSFLSENPGLAPLLFSGCGSLPQDIGVEVRERIDQLTVTLYERAIRTGMLQTHYREVDARLAARVFQGIVAALLSDAAYAGEGLAGVETVALDLFEKGIRRTV